MEEGDREEIVGQGGEEREGGKKDREERREKERR